jgi:hypothetical protein
MADDWLAILIGIVQNQHNLQQQMAEQNRQKKLENFPLRNREPETVLKSKSYN